MRFDELFDGLCVGRVLVIFWRMVCVVSVDIFKMEVFRCIRWWGCKLRV